MAQYNTLQVKQLESNLQQAINAFLRGEVLPRIGVPDSRDVGINYDPTKGEFTLFIPKNKCVKCGRKADFEKAKLKYCESHLPKD